MGPIVENVWRCRNCRKPNDDPCVSPDQDITLLVIERCQTVEPRRLSESVDTRYEITQAREYPTVCVHIYTKVRGINIDKTTVLHRFYTGKLCKAVQGTVRRLLPFLVYS